MLDIHVRIKDVKIEKAIKKLQREEERKSINDTIVSILKRYFKKPKK